MNAATRRRKYEQPEDKNAWLWEDLPDPYANWTEVYNPSRNKTGVDFRYNKMRELNEFPGQVTRIDMIEIADGTPVKRTWTAGWMPGDKPFEAKPLEIGWTIENAADHLEKQGWTVRRWHNQAGRLEARAFRCGLRCVRTLGYKRRWEERQGTHVLAATGLDSRFDG
jgi:hypothetical protein